MGFKRFNVIILAVISLVALTACRQETNKTSKTVKVGIIQYAEHSALDEARKGFIEGLSEGGYKKGKILN